MKGPIVMFIKLVGLLKIKNILKKIKFMEHYDKEKINALDEVIIFASIRNLHIICNIEIFLTENPIYLW